MTGAQSRTPFVSPKRSCLFMPGSNPRALAKAPSLDADCFLLDLEDAVAIDAKGLAREQICATLDNNLFGERDVLVRINPLASPWGDADLSSAVQHQAAGIIVPKINSAGDVAAIDRLLSDRGAGAGFQLWIMIETPLAILNIQSIAAMSEQSRLSGMILGLNDLAKDLGASASTDRFIFTTAMSMTVMAARAYGLVAIDSVFNNFKDEAGFTQQCQQARDYGFHGKSLIHPSQIETANDLFSPSEAALSQAQKIVEAFSRPENRHAGVITVDGEMTERLHLEQAEALLALHAAIIDSRK